MKTMMMLALLGAVQDDAGLKVGDPAPKFESTSDAGKAWSSSDVVGKKVVVVFFYPAAFTGG